MCCVCVSLFVQAAACPRAAGLHVQASMVTASRIDWVICQLQLGRLMKMKLSTHADRTTLQLVLAPGGNATQQNGLAVAWLEHLRGTLNQTVAVDHGHRKSTGEAFVSVTLRPVLVQQQQQQQLDVQTATVDNEMLAQPASRQAAGGLSADAPVFVPSAAAPAPHPLQEPAAMEVAPALQEPAAMEAASAVASTRRIAYPTRADGEPPGGSEGAVRAALVRRLVEEFQVAPVDAYAVLNASGFLLHPARRMIAAWLEECGPRS